jgi:small subunit ribosomal protein S18
MRNRTTGKGKTGKNVKTKKTVGFLSPRKKMCRFCADRLKLINYKDLKILESFVKERGRVISARVSGNCARHQRQLMRAVKKARFLALVPYVRL